MQLSGLTSLGKWLMNKINGGEDSYGSGHDFCTLEQAMSYAPVWHCVSKITGAFKIMPLNVLQYASGTKKKSVKDNHPAYQLTRWKPNSFMTPSVFKSVMVTHALMLGNARAYIRRSSDSPDSSPIDLIPLAPDRTATVVLEGRKVHGSIVRRGDPIEVYFPVESGKQERHMFFENDEILHIPGLSYDGISGYSLLDLACRSWSIGIGAEKQARKFQKKGYSGGLMLEVPESSPMFRTEKDAQEFLDAFRKNHEGNDPAKSTIGMLRGGIKANAINMSNIDAQFLEQRKFQREDAALQFCLEGILGDSSNASYNSLEQRNLAYRQNCLAPWTVSWEEECELKLLTESERKRGYYIKFNDGALLRTEKQVTASIGSQLIASRVMNPNEVREWFDMNPYEGGDEYVNPAIDKKVDNGPGGASNLPDPMTTPTTETNAALAMIGNLVGVEQKRVIHACKSPNFVERIQSFYKEWENKLADSIEKIGGDRHLASRHCQESQRQLIDLAQQTENLPERVSECVKLWQNRVPKLIEGIVK